MMIHDDDEQIAGMEVCPALAAKQLGLPDHTTVANGWAV